MQRGLQQLEAGSGPGVADALRIVDAYIKAYYLPWGPELRHWVATHPEYTRSQLNSLLHCIAEANGLKRRERQSMLAEIDQDLGTGPLSPM